MKRISQLLLTSALITFALKLHAQKVTLDYYFNHETHKIKDGTTKRFHYMWDETANTGFSVWGGILESKGAILDTLGDAPTLKNLKGSSVYIIVDPDSKKENVSPNYITGKDAGQIAAWVKAGGILVMMANDSANVDLEHFNVLAAKFGMHFNDDLQNHVIDDAHFNDGEALVCDTTIFKTGRKIFLKDVCSINCSFKNYTAVLKSRSGSNIAIRLKYGQGIVFAVGDPWLYNEYVNGRLPSYYDNYGAANDLSNWLLGSSKNFNN